jgi:hypothetical protein
MAIRTVEDFYRAVRRMRAAQTESARTRSCIDRNAARRREAEVDRFIEGREWRLADQKQGVLLGGGG